MAPEQKDERKEYRFVVTGVPGGAVRRDGAPRTGFGGGIVRESIALSAQRAGGQTTQATAVAGEDVVVLRIDNGPELVLHPETARLLLLSQGSETRGARRGRIAGGDRDEVNVPVRLRWQGLTTPARGSRGAVGDAVLSLFQIVRLPRVKSGLADAAADKIGTFVDGRVTPGVYTLSPQKLEPFKPAGVAPLPRVPAPPAGEPLLVLVHGTFSDTAGTFGKFWDAHPDLVATLFKRYGNRVYALDHPTLGESPIANAIKLAEALPDGARLHLATHSRGGLVAEVLARLAGRAAAPGDAELAAFKGSKYAGQREQIRTLHGLLKQRGIRVERIVRVACPARGTLLASRRLDAYVSVIKWALHAAGAEIAAELVDFLGEVARRRVDPAILPGLAAMLPDSPLVVWLNDPHALVEAGELRVVAGDLQADGLGSWLKTLAADIFFWQDNDIVVHTRSMYGGTPRKAGSSFVFDQGGEVSHFAYFTNELTARAVVSGLTDASPEGFRPIGPLSWRGEDAAGLRARREARKPQPDKPALFLLPGILGSNLKVDGDRVWLGWQIVGGLQRLEWKPGATNVEPDGPVGLSYDAITEHLAATHEVIGFGYDWRAPLEEQARKLGKAVRKALDARKASGQPVRLLAHSMGGLLARALQLECQDVWNELMQHDGARLVMLGTPNGGSFAPMAVLSGDDGFVNLLTDFGAPFQDHKARQMMARMPGFLQLQLGVDDTARLGREATWKKLADDDLHALREHNWWHTMLAETASETPYQWGVPPQPVLDAARALRLRLDEQARTVLPGFAARIKLVVGRARSTPVDYEVADDGELSYLASDDGDGRVPLTSALLDGVDTWWMDAEHGDLPAKKDAFDAIAELLATGTTRLLRRQAALRGRAGDTTDLSTSRTRTRPSRELAPLLPPADEGAVFGGSRRAAGSVRAAAGAALHIAVCNGDLSYARQALMIGHYRSFALTGSEWVVDRLVGGKLGASLLLGRYPEAAADAQVFVNVNRDPGDPLRKPLPEAAIVVGLGDEGKLEESQLAEAVRQGTIAWAQHLAETPGAAPGFELAATLLGSSGVGIDAGASARAIAQGVRAANDALAQQGWPCATGLTLIELYLERAADAWHALRLLQTADPGRFAVADEVAFGTGALRRPLDGSYRGAKYDFVTATSPEKGTIAYTIDTRRARTEVRARKTQLGLIQDMVAQASTADGANPRIGRTLFQLLVPVELEPFLGGRERMVLELDERTAPIPWELLDTPEDRRGGRDLAPWAIRTRMLRKLRTEVFREDVRDPIDDDALVIGEPAIGDPDYPPLPGAVNEANHVADELGRGGRQVTKLLKADGRTIVGALLERPWRIVHVAGHGEPLEKDDNGKLTGKGGIVLSKDRYLGPNEISAMRTVPELVFVNCCHLADRDAAGTLAAVGLAQLAASTADALIALGVRCVIAAGWAVEDEAAAEFAQALYRELGAGQPFSHAVEAARCAARDKGGNTWAAYQCYGDPDWRLVRDGKTAKSDLQDVFGDIASPVGLALALETIAQESRWQHAKPEDQVEKLEFLEQHWGGRWGGMGAVAEAFGVAYAAAGRHAEAVRWYRDAVAAEDASASFKAREQLLNLKARTATARARSEKDAGRLAALRGEIEDALAELRKLAKDLPTQERWDLVGSAYKRLAIVEIHRGGDGKAALEAARKAYAEAEKLARGHANLHYPMMNRMAIDLLLQDGAGTPGLKAADIEAARASLAAQVRDDPDFWSIVGQVELDLYEALAAHDLAGRGPLIGERFAQVQRRADAPSNWASVADQADLILQRCARGRPAAEQRAAQALLDQLRAYAGRSG